ncbi:MAG: aspartate-semialdehyde dehydrogenase [Phycisphaerales bacterium]
MPEVLEGPSSLRSAHIAVVGAFGLVGREALAILEAIGVPAQQVRALGSSRSAGASIPYQDSTLEIAEYQDPSVLEDLDLALLCTDADTARSVAEPAVRAGIRVVDNSSAFRLEPATPLVIPEVNGTLLDARPLLVANPNCSTILLMLATEPFRRAFGLRSIIVSTYQAVSGAGRAAHNELLASTKGFLDGAEPEPAAFPVPCAFNVFPHESPVDEQTGLNVEESKIIAESRKILQRADLDIAPTCVRVPVERCHSQAVVLELERRATLAEVVEAASSFPGVAFTEDPTALVTPRDIAGSEKVSISRARLSRDGHRLSIWVCGDQLRKGAALNAIQIAERLLASA